MGLNQGYVHVQVYTCTLPTSCCRWCITDMYCCDLPVLYVVYTCCIIHVVDVCYTPTSRHHSVPCFGRFASCTVSHPVHVHVHVHVHVVHVVQYTYT